MAPAFENGQSHQDAAATRESLVDINTEPTPPAEPGLSLKPHRKRLADAQDPADDTDNPQPEAKPQRRRLSPAQQADREEPAPVPEPRSSSGRPRLSIAQSQTAVLEAPEDTEPPHEPASANAQGTSPAQGHVDPARIEQWIADLRARQNFLLATGSGLLAAVVGALVWAVITVTTNYQVSWMAIGAGLLVGGVVRVFGRGLDKSFGYLGAGLSLVSCLIGNYLANCMFIAREVNLSVTSVLTQVNPAAVPKVMMATFHPMDLLFYGLAVYMGYYFSFRRITQAQISCALQSK